MRTCLTVFRHQRRVAHSKEDSMKSQTAGASRTRRIAMATTGLAAAATLLAGCAAPADGGTGGDDDAIGVTLIVKTEANPFFVAMQEGAEAAAEEAGVELTFAAGSED